MKRMTRIEAVKKITQLTGDGEVSTEEDLDTIPGAIEASSQLDISTVDILTDFEWFFNTVPTTTVTADGNGEMVIPDDLTYITFLQASATITNNLRPVGGKVYDIVNNTTVFDAGTTVTYKGQRCFDFEDLPWAFQQLAIADAREYIATGRNHTAPQRAQAEQKAFNEAFVTALKFDKTLSGGRISKLSKARRRPPGNRGYI